MKNPRPHQRSVEPSASQTQRASAPETRPTVNWRVGIFQRLSGATLAAIWLLFLPAPATAAATAAQPPVIAPQPGGVDLSFHPGSSINGTVYSVATQPDGKVLIVGDFTTINEAMRGRVARLNPDGTTDHTFMNGLEGTDGRIRCVSVQADGKVLIGGEFTTVNGLPRKGIVRLHPDGTVDTTFLSGLQYDYVYVFSLVVQPDGQVLVAGYFGFAGGGSHGNIARLNADGSLDTTFSAWADWTVEAVMLLSDGKVLIGGLFSNVNGAGRKYVARLYPDGSLDSAFLSGLEGPDHFVQSLAVQADGKILIGGFFSTVNGASRNRIARLESDGRLDPSFLDGLAGTDRGVESVAVQPDGKVVIAGSFTNVNGVARSYVARLNADGSLDTDFHNGLEGASASEEIFTIVECVMVQTDGKILVGGQFTMVSNVPRASVARLEADGNLDAGFTNPLDGASDGVASVVLQEDGKILVGGCFRTFNRQPRQYVARLHPDGSLDPGFLNGLEGPNGCVGSVLVQPDGKVIIGGDFTSVNGVPRKGIARLHADGSLDTDFSSSLQGDVVHMSFVFMHSLALQTDGKVLVTYWASDLNGVGRPYLVRLNADGSPDTGFLNGLPGPDDQVLTMAPQPDGKLLIGGWFRMVNGLPRNHLARLNPDGTVDTGFLNGLPGSDGLFFSIVVQEDGKVLVGGLFNTVNGAPRHCIARLHADGTLDSTFLNGLAGVEGQVYSMAVQPDGHILIAGYFWSVNGVSRNQIARLNAYGGLDTSFLDNLEGPQGGVFSLALQADGRILIGGSFGGVNQIPLSGVARLWGGYNPVILTQPQDQTVVWHSTAILSLTAVGAEPLSYQWWFNESSLIANATNASLTISDAQTVHAGDYVAVVSNAFGSVTSQVARITVIPVPLSEAVRELTEQVQESGLPPHRLKPLLASLRAASASFDRGSFMSGFAQLAAFQAKVRAQLAPHNAELASQFIEEAQQIMDSIQDPAPGRNRRVGAKTELN